MRSCRIDRQGGVAISRGDESVSQPSKGSSRTGRSKAAQDNRSRQLNPKDRAYEQSRNERSAKSAESGNSWRERMTREDAARIQSHADKSGRNEEFKQRSQRAAEKNEEK